MIIISQTEIDDYIGQLTAAKEEIPPEHLIIRELKNIELRSYINEIETKDDLLEAMEELLNIIEEYTL